MNHVEYQYFKQFNSPIMDYIRDHYDLLKQDFFNNIASSELMNHKPGYTFLDGVTDLYKGTIMSCALKNSRVALDADEQRIMNWQPEEEYRYNYRRVDPKVSGPWVNLVEKFDPQLEQMFFNVAYPGATITRHRGIHTRYFRVHICLQTNPAFYFEIEGELKSWQEGVDKAFAFDDANRLHAVYFKEELSNNVPRTVAILDIKKEFYPEMFGL